VAATRCNPVFKRTEFLGISWKRRGSQLPNSRKNDYHSHDGLGFPSAWFDPSYIIGGVSKDLGNNAHAGTCDYFVIEADEYDNMFLGLTPHIEVVMSLEHDHPDIFPTRESYNQAFVRFVKRLEYSGTLIACADDKGALWLANNHKRDDIRTLMYGTSPRANYRAENLAPNQRGGFDFTASFHDAFLANVSLKVRANTTPSMPCSPRDCPCDGFGCRNAAASLGEISGTGRRFELLGEASVTIIDDYAHHPTAIAPPRPQPAPVSLTAHWS